MSERVNDLRIWAKWARVVAGADELAKDLDRAADTIASLRELVKELRAGLESALTLPDQTLARATEPDLRKMTATANEQDALLSRLSDLIAKADKATGDE